MFPSSDTQLQDGWNALWDEEGLKLVDTGLFWVCSSVVLPLTLCWLLLGTTFSLRHVRQSLKGAAAER